MKRGNIRLDRLESQLDEDILLEASDFLSLYPPDIEERGKKSVTLTFRADQGDVLVKIKRSEDEITQCDCSEKECESKKFCLHIGAACLALRSLVATEKVKTAAKEQEFLSSLDMRLLLKDTDKETLAAFISEQVRKSPILKFTLKARLIRSIAFIPEINPYQMLLDEFLQIDRYGKIALGKRNLGHLLKITEDFILYLKEDLLIRNYEEAMKILQALLLKLHLLRYKLPDVDERVEAQLKACYVQCHAFCKAEIAPQLKEKFFRFGLMLASKLNYTIISDSHNIFTCILPLISDEKDKKEFLQLLEEIAERHEGPESAALVLKLNKEINAGSSFIPDPGSWPLEKAMEFLQILLNNGGYSDLLEAGNRLYQQGKITPAFEEDFHVLMLSAALESMNLEQALPHYAFMVHLGEQDEYLEKLVSTFPKDIDQIISRLKSYHGLAREEEHFLDIRAELHHQKNAPGDLLNLIRTSGSLVLFAKFGKELISWNKQLAIDTLTEVLEAELTQFAGPKSNSRILKALAVLDKCGHGHERSKITDALLKKFPERISLKKALKGYPVELFL